MDILAANVAQQSARLASQGDFEEARANNIVWGRMMAKQARQLGKKDAFGAWLNDMSSFDNSVTVQHQQQQSNLAQRGLTYSARKVLSKKSKKRKFNFRFRKR